MMKLLALLSVFLLSPLTFKAPVTQNLKLEKSQDIIKDKATYIVSKPFDKTINTFEASIVFTKRHNKFRTLGCYIWKLL